MAKSNYDSRILSAVDASGNLYHCGNLSNNYTVDFNLIDTSSSDPYSYIAKVDAQGNLIWSHTFPSSININPLFKKIICLNSGEIVCMGIFLGSIDINPGPDTCMLSSFGGANGFMIKLSSDGEFIWGKAILGAPHPLFPSVVSGYSLWMNDMDHDATGNIYLVGSAMGCFDFNSDTSEFLAYGTSLLDRLMFLLKINTDGEFEFVKTLSSVEYGYDTWHAVHINQENEILTAGLFFNSIHIQSSYLDTVITTQWYTDGSIVLKYDSTGEIKHVQAETTIFWYKEIKTDSFGNTYVMSVKEYPNKSGEVLLQKFSDENQLVWEKLIGGYNNDSAVSLSLLSDTLFVVAMNAFQYDSLFFDGQFIQYHEHNNNYLLFIDSSGSLVQQNSFGSGILSSMNCHGTEAIYLAGFCYDEMDFDPGNGVYISAEMTSGVFIERLNLPIELPLNGIALYPNPTENLITINLGAFECPVHLIIFDYQGKLLRDLDLTQQISVVDLNSMNQGLLLLNFFIPSLELNKTYRVVKY